MRISDEDDMSRSRSFRMGKPKSRVGETACGERVEELQIAVSTKYTYKNRPCGALSSNFCLADPCIYALPNPLVAWKAANRSLREISDATGCI